MNRILTRTWPYGTTRRGTVRTRQVLAHGSKTAVILKVVDDRGEGHCLLNCGDAPQGTPGTLTFTKGGPTGGFWRFTADPQPAPKEG